MFYQAGLSSNWEVEVETLRHGSSGLGALNCEMGQEGAEVGLRDLYHTCLGTLGY